MDEAKNLLESKVTYFTSFNDIKFFLGSSDANCPQEISKDFVPHFRQLLDQAIDKGSRANVTVLVQIVQYLLEQHQVEAIQTLISCGFHHQFPHLLGFAFEGTSKNKKPATAQADQLFIAVINIVIEYCKTMNDHCMWLFQNMLHTFMEIISDANVFHFIRTKTVDPLIGIFGDDDKELVTFLRRRIEKDEQYFDSLCEGAIQSLSRTGDFRLQESIVELIFRLWPTGIRKRKAAMWLKGNQKIFSKFALITYDKFDYGVRNFLDEVNSACARRRVLTLRYKAIILGCQELVPSNRWCNCIDFCYQSRVLDIRLPTEQLDDPQKCSWNMNGVKATDLAYFYVTENTSACTIDLHLELREPVSKVLDDFTMEDRTVKRLIIQFLRVIPLDADHMIKFASTLFGKSFSENRWRTGTMSQPRSMISRNADFVESQPLHDIALNASFIKLSQPRATLEGSVAISESSPSKQIRSSLRIENRVMSDSTLQHISDKALNKYSPVHRGSVGESSHMEVNLLQATQSQSSKCFSRCCPVSVTKHQLEFPKCGDDLKDVIPETQLNASNVVGLDTSKAAGLNTSPVGMDASIAGDAAEDISVDLMLQCLHGDEGRPSAKDHEVKNCAVTQVADVWDQACFNKRPKIHKSFCSKRKKRSLISEDVVKPLEEPSSDASQKQSSVDPALRSVRQMPFASKFIKTTMEPKPNGKRNLNNGNLRKTRDSRNRYTMKGPRNILKDLNVELLSGEVEKKLRSVTDSFTSVEVTKGRARRTSTGKKGRILPFQELEEFPDFETARDIPPDNEFRTISSPESFIPTRSYTKPIKVTTETLESSKMVKKKRPRVSFEAGLPASQERTYKEKKPKRFRKMELFNSTSSAADSATSSELSWITEHRCNKLSSSQMLKTYKGKKGIPVELPSLCKLSREQKSVFKFQNLTTACNMTFDDIAFEQERVENPMLVKEILETNQTTSGSEYTSLDLIVGWENLEKNQESLPNPLSLAVARCNSLTPMDTTERRVLKSSPVKRKAATSFASDKTNEDKFMRSKKRLKLSNIASPGSWRSQSSTNLKLNSSCQNQGYSKQLVVHVGNYIKRIDHSWDAGSLQRKSYLQHLQQKALASDRHHTRYMKELGDLQELAVRFVKDFNFNINKVMKKAASNILATKVMLSEHVMEQSGASGVQEKAMENLKRDIEMAGRNCLK